MKKIIIVLLMIAICIFTTGCSGVSVKATLDFKKCIDVTYSGSNGEGTAYINTDTDYLLSALSEVDTVSAAEILSSFKINPPENNGSLKNGDIITVNVIPDPEKLKGTGIGVTNTELTFTVSGLSEKESVYIFKDVSLTVTGASPYCKLSVEYAGNLPINSYYFSIVGTDGQETDTYKDGDTVTVILNKNNIAGLIEKYEIKEFEHTYTVKADSTYILSPDDLDADKKEMLDKAIAQTLENQITNIIDNNGGAGSAIISRLTGYDIISVSSSSAKVERIENLTFGGAYVGATNGKHYIYCFYEADFTHNYKSEQTIHAVLVLQLSEPTISADGVNFTEIISGARKDLATAENDFITADYESLS